MSPRQKGLRFSGAAVLFVLHSEIKRSRLTCGSCVRDAGKLHKQTFAMFLIVISSAWIYFPNLVSLFNTIHPWGWKTDLNRDLREFICRRGELAAAGGPGGNVQVRSGGVEPGATTAVARGPERALPRPGWGLCLPAATWHRTRAQGSIMQAWPRNPEQGRDSYILQQAPFSWQTWGKLMLLLCLSFWKRNGYTNAKFTRHDFFFESAGRSGVQTVQLDRIGEITGCSHYKTHLRHECPRNSFRQEAWMTALPATKQGLT